jgi:hypothetical protein
VAYRVYITKQLTANPMVKFAVTRKISKFADGGIGFCRKWWRYRTVNSLHHANLRQPSTELKRERQRVHVRANRIS